MSAPFDMELIRARLRSEVPDLRQVRGSADYTAITAIKDFVPPEAFVLLARERGGALAGQARQPAAVFFGVVVAVRNARYQRGTPLVEAMSPLVGEIRKALIGWTPTVNGAPVPGGRPCTWVQGDLLDHSVDTLLWSEVYQTQHFVGRPQ